MGFLFCLFVCLFVCVFLVGVGGRGGGGGSVIEAAAATNISIVIAPIHSGKSDLILATYTLTILYTKGFILS